jgi:Flp pilus assembly protein TadG
VNLRSFITHTGGATAVEFALTAPVFFAIVFGLIDTGLMLWTQLGLQHATELAARCASVNKTICPDATSIRIYAASQVFGMTVPSSVFTAAQPACGNRISASFDFGLIGGYYGTPLVTLSAASCFPK